MPKPEKILKLGFIHLNSVLTLCYTNGIRDIKQYVADNEDHLWQASLCVVTERLLGMLVALAVYVRVGLHVRALSHVRSVEVISTPFLVARIGWKIEPGKTSDSVRDTEECLAVLVMQHNLDLSTQPCQVVGKG